MRIKSLCGPARWAFLIVVTVTIPARAGASRPSRPTVDSLNMVTPAEPAPSPGHPRADQLDALLKTATASPFTPVGVDDPPLEIPVLSPLEAGTFVNFESPQVAPLALSDDGMTLFAANTPNNSLAVLSAVDDLTVVNEIPVGLEPVSVAVQPETGGKRVWVANFISDNISIVDMTAGAVETVIEVGDEPVNILFDPTGAWAFVVVQGITTAPTDIADPAGVRLGNVVVIDTATLQIVSHTYLDVHTPRSVVYDPVNQQVVVAALYSGNNTTVVGTPITMHTTNPPPPDPNNCEQQCNCDCVNGTILEIVRDFSVTAALFATTPGLGVWPDPHTDPTFPPSPKVHRIINDAGTPGGWNAIVDVLSDANGNPDPAMVTLINQEFGITNALEIVETILDDVKDTDDRDLVFLDASNPADPAGLPIVRVQSRVGTTQMGMARNPIDGTLFVSNLQARNLVRGTVNLRGHIVDHEIVMVPPGAVALTSTAVDLHGQVQNFNDVSFDNVDAQRASLADPVGIVFDADGNVAYVAAAGPGRVGALNGATAAVIGRVDVGRGPRGLVLDSQRDRLYVMNRTDLSISVVSVNDPTAMQVLETLPLFNPEPQKIQDGRDFLYSTRFSENFASSCETCHINGTLDQLGWDLSDFSGSAQPGPPNLPALNHPIKGPMVTLSLQGLKDHTPLHWRGDKPVFQDFNEAFVNLLGASEELSTEEMDQYAAFIDTLVYPPNPFYERNNAFKDQRALSGAGLYITACDPCHEVILDPALVDGHDGALDGATLDPPVDGDGGLNLNGGLFAQLQLVTQLRGIYKKANSDRFTGFGLVHDGREEREGNEHPLQTFLQQFFPNFDASAQLDMIAFINAFPTNVMTVVGWQIAASGQDDPTTLGSKSADLNLMAAQFAKAPSHNDVVAHGTLGGKRVGLYMVTNTPEPIFESDAGVTLASTELFGSLEAADVMVFTAVPPGSGRRIGIDQDSDCLGDGLDAQPQKNNAHDANYDDVVDLADFNELFACSLLDGPVLGTCQLFDSDCSGLLDSVDFQSFVNAYEAGHTDCNANTVDDLLDILNGTSLDIDANGLPDECCVRANPPVFGVNQVAKNRYLSFSAGQTGQVAAVRVTFVDLPGDYAVLNGTSWWVGAPELVSENSGSVGVIGQTPSFQAATLECSPEYLDWNAYGTVHIWHEAIVPGGVYEIQVLDFSCPSAVESNYSDALSLTQSVWGDTSGPFDGDSGSWTPPDGVVNVGADIVAALDKFKNVPSAPIKARVDIDPSTPDRQITITDITRGLDAFRGLAYPFHVSVGPCAP